MDYTKFLVDKGLNEILESVHLDSIKNRVLVAQISKSTSNTKKARSSMHSESASQKRFPSKSSLERASINLRKGSDDKFTGSFFTKTFSKISSQSDYHIFLISQKPLNPVDEEHFSIDDEIMNKDILKEPVKFNQLYFYEYESTGDSSEPKKLLEVERINSVHAVINKDEFHLKIILEAGKKYYFLFRFATEALLWLNGLRRAIQTQEEFSRSKCGVLKYNIGLLYQFHENSKWGEIQEVVDSIVSRLDSQKYIKTFLGELETTIKEINFFCDAFFSFKPFMKSLFESMIKSIHVTIRSALMDFWNRFNLEMTAGEILALGKNVHWYQSMLRTWGVIDRKLDKCNKPLITTFCNRLFQSSKEILFNVIDDAMFKFRVEHGKFRNDSIRILEAHINLCFDNYAQYPTRATAHELLRMISIMITVVQVNLITQIQNPKKNLDAEVLASLLNNEYDEVIKKFMNKVQRKAKGQLQISDIQTLFNYEYLQRNNIKIGEECLRSLNNKIQLEVENIFRNHQVIFNQFKIKKVIDEIDKVFSHVFLGLRHDHEKFDIMDKLCLQLLDLYFEAFLRFSERISHSTLELLLHKIPKDQAKMFKYFRPLVGNDVDCHLSIMTDLTLFLETHDYEESRILILKILAFLDSRHLTQDNINRLIQCKYYFSSYQIEKMVGEFTQIKRESDLQSFKSKSIIRKVGRVTTTVKKFASMLKRKIRSKKSRISMIRTDTTDFRPQQTTLMIPSFSVDEIYSFSSPCSMVKFPLSLSDAEVPHFLNSHLESRGK